MTRRAAALVAGMVAHLTASQTAAFQNDTPAQPGERAVAVAAGRRSGNAPAGDRGTRAGCLGAIQQDKRSAMPCRRQIKPAAGGQIRPASEGAGHHGGLRLGPQRLLERPQRFLIGLGLDQDQPVNSKAKLGKAVPIRCSVLSQYAPGGDENGGPCPHLLAQSRQGEQESEGCRLSGIGSNYLIEGSPGETGWKPPIEPRICCPSQGRQAHRRSLRAAAPDRGGLHPFQGLSQSSNAHLG